MCILGSREHTCVHPEISKLPDKNDNCKKLLDSDRVSACNLLWLSCKMQYILINFYFTNFSPAPPPPSSTIFNYLNVCTCSVGLSILPQGAGQARVSSPAQATGSDHGLGHRRLGPNRKTSEGTFRAALTLIFCSVMSFTLNSNIK